MVVTRIATGKMMTEKGIIAIAVIVKMIHQTTKIKIGIEKGAGDTEMRKSTTRGQGTLTIITITIAATASASLFSRLNTTGKRVQGICIAMDGWLLSLQDFEALRRILSVEALSNLYLYQANIYHKHGLSGLARHFWIHKKKQNKIRLGRYFLLSIGCFFVPQ
jgi:hypothetical protein